mgnify:CR=1 FL=1|tara:strand:- start:482 stop:832 length:351 start_codon:yes stop_codon:yes gene_type:complete
MLKNLMIVFTALTIFGGALPSGVEAAHKLAGHATYFHADSVFDETHAVPQDSNDQQSNDTSANCAENLNCLHNVACMPTATSWNNSASGSCWLAISVNKMNNRVYSPELSPPIVTA